MKRITKKIIEEARKILLSWGKSDYNIRAVADLLGVAYERLKNRLKRK